MTWSARDGLVRIHGRGGAVIGAGFLVDRTTVITAAHVVEEACSPAGLLEQLPPDYAFEVDVWLNGEWSPLQASLIPSGWIPLENKRGDVAALRLEVEEAFDITSVRLRVARGRSDIRFRTHGFPKGHPLGIGATGVIRAGLVIGAEWSQLEDDKVTGRRLEQGFSGAPVYDQTGTYVVGMVVAADRGAPEAKVGAMLPVETLTQYWPPLAKYVSNAVTTDPDHWEAHARGVENVVRPGSLFTGRRNVIAAFQEWLKSTDGSEKNVRIITGSPGSGKSAVISRLVALSDPYLFNRAVLPFMIDRPEPEQAASGMINLAILARGKSAKEVLAEIAEHIDAEMTDQPAQAIISHILRTNSPLTIAIDALDEAAEPYSLARALHEILRQLTDVGFRILLATRPGAGGRLVEAFHPDAVVVNLDSPEFAKLGDLVEYSTSRLLQPWPRLGSSPYAGREESAAHIARQISEQAYPSFLVAQLVTSALINRGRAPEPDDADLKNLPTSLVGGLRRYFDSTEDPEKTEDLLVPLAFTYGNGLTPGALWASLATALARRRVRPYQVEDLEWILDVAADFMIEGRDGAAPTYQLHHEAFAEYFRDRVKLRSKPPDEFEPSELVFKTIFDSVPRDHDNLNWAAADPYVAEHLADHAADTGQLPRLLAEVGFLAVADPPNLISAMDRSKAYSSLAAKVYRRAYNRLVQTPAPQRAAQLQLEALMVGADALAAGFARLSSRLAWTPRWATSGEGQQYVIATQQRNAVNAVVSTRLSGRPVLVSAGWDRAIYIWDVENASPFRTPIATDHRAPIFGVGVGVKKGSEVLITASSDRSVRLWDAMNGKRVGEPLEMHQGQIHALAVGRLGDRCLVATGGNDCTVRLYDLESGQDVGAHHGHKKAVAAVAFTHGPEGLLVLSGAEDGNIAIWNPDAAGNSIQMFGPGDRLGSEGVPAWATVRCLATAEVDGRDLIISGHADKTVRVWDRQSRAMVGNTMLGHTGEITGLAMVEEGGRKLIVSGSDDSTIRVWDLASGRPVGVPIRGHSGGISSVATFNLQGRNAIVSASDDHTVRIWDLDVETVDPSVFIGPTATVIATRIVQERGRTLLVAADTSAGVHLWDVRTHEPIATGRQEGGNGDDGDAVSADIAWVAGRIIVAFGFRSGRIDFWDPLAGAPVRPSINAGWLGRRRSIAVGEVAGRMVCLSGDRDGTVRCWDLEANDMHGALITKLSSPPSDLLPSVVSAMALTRYRGRDLAFCATTNGPIEIWDVGKKQRVGKPLTGHAADATGANALWFGVVEGRPVLASASSPLDRSIRLWELTALESNLLRRIGNRRRPEIMLIEGEIGWPKSLELTERDGRPIVVSGGQDNAIRFWDGKTGRLIGEPLAGHADDVESISLGELDGEPILASGSGDRTVRLWDVKQRAPLGSRQAGHRGPVEALVLVNRDGEKIVISGGKDNTVRFWDAGTGLPKGNPILTDTVVQLGIVSLAAVNVAGRSILAVGDVLGGVRLYDASSGLPAGDPIEPSFSGEFWPGRNPIALGCIGGRPIILSLHKEGGLIVRDVETGRPSGAHLSGYDSPTTALSIPVIGQESSLVYSGHDDGTIRVWDLRRGAELGKLRAVHRGAVTAISTDDVNGRTTCVSGSRGGDILRWEIGGGPSMHTVIGSGNATITSVALVHNDDGFRLSVGTADGILNVVRPGAEFVAVPTGSSINALCWPSARSLVMALESGIVCVDFWQ